MHKLFSLSFRRIASRLNQPELNALNVAQALQNNNIGSSGEPFLYRLPRDELKHILNISCPINSLEDPSTPAIVAAAKALRHHAKIKEEKICAKCPFRQNCVSAKQSFTGTVENAPKDLLIFWSGLSNLANPQQVFYRHWVSAYKLGDNILASLDDVSQGGKEIEQFQNLRQQMLKFNEENHKSPEGSQTAETKESQEPKETKKVNKPANKKANQQSNSSQNPAEQNAGQQKQIFGRDFSFDEVEQFEPETKFSKDNFKQKQPKESKNVQSKGEKGYKFIERNENVKFDKNRNQQNKEKRYTNYQQDEEDMPSRNTKNYRTNSDYQSDRKPYNQNRNNNYNPNSRYGDQQSYQRRPRQQNYKNYNNKKYDNRRYSEEEDTYSQKTNKYRGANQRTNNYQNRDSYQNRDNYQNRNYEQRSNQRDNQRQYNERRPNRNYQQNEDQSRGPKKYQREEYEVPRNQREQKKENKPNPFVSKWNASQDFDESLDFKEFKQPKARKQQSEATEQRRQAKEQPQSKPNIKIIQTQNIQDRTQTEGRAGRNVRRRGRTTSNADIQTTTE